MVRAAQLRRGLRVLRLRHRSHGAGERCSANARRVPRGCARQRSSPRAADPIRESFVGLLAPAGRPRRERGRVHPNRRGHRSALAALSRFERSGSIARAAAERGNECASAEARTGDPARPDSLEGCAHRALHLPAGGPRRAAGSAQRDAPSHRCARANVALGVGARDALPVQRCRSLVGEETECARSAAPRARRA